MKVLLDKTRLFSTLFVLLAFVVIFVLLLSTVYSSYVAAIKKEEMLEAYTAINAVSGDSTQLGDVVSAKEYKYNFKIFITNLSNNTQLIPFSRGTDLNLRMRPSLEFFDEILHDEKYAYLDEKDPISNNDFLSFVGKLDKGGYMFIRVSTSFVIETVRYTINFVIISAVLAFLLAICVLYYFSKREQRIDTMKQNILINVSHDLKTPIFLIQSYAEGLKQNINENKEDKDFYCDVILDESRRMDKMVKEILTLAKMEATKTPVNREAFSIGELIGEIISKNKIKIQDKGIHLSVKIHNAQVNADKRMIESAITNILTNAIDHAPENGEIEIHTEVKHSRVRVFVFNNGPSIPKEELNNIWQTFYKLDTNIKRDYGGSGVGLSVVKSVMESHGSKYGVFSADDGVTFYLDIHRPSNKFF